MSKKEKETVDKSVKKRENYSGSKETRDYIKNKNEEIASRKKRY